MTTPTATQRALRCLHDGGWNGVTAGEVGASVWPDRECRPGRGVAVNGGGDYVAQMLLGRLKKAGLVEYAASEGSSRWRLSTKGRSEVRKMPSTKAPKEPNTRHMTGRSYPAPIHACAVARQRIMGVIPSIRDRRAAKRATTASPTKPIQRLRKHVCLRGSASSAND